MSKNKSVQVENVSTGRASSVIRMAIVEDNDDMRRSLSRLFTGAEGFACVGTHASAESALQALPKERLDVVLMDINLPGIDGIECVRRLKPQMPSTVFVMLTVYENTERIFLAIQAGASGYLLKRTDSTELLRAIQDASSGGAPMTSLIARKVLDAFRYHLPASSKPEASVELSAREQEVLQLLARGFLLKEIADRLNLSYTTVRTYTQRIYEKLHVRSRSEAAARYFQTHRQG